MDSVSDFTSQRPVRKVFTSRVGGVSHAPYESFNLGTHVGDVPEDVAENRRRLAHSLDLSSECFVWMEQVHSNTVTVVSEPHPDPVPTTDALVTTCPGLVLGVLVADCTPVLLSDHEAGVVAAVHAGRLGARNGIVARTVERMLALGATASHIHALLGPAAAGASYEVPRELAEDMETHLPGSKTTTSWGTYGVDIRRGLVHQLHHLGVTAVDVDPRDTITDESFFSYRREGTTGRQAGLVWLTQE